MNVIFITALNSAARRIMFLDDCCVPFARRKTIGYSVLITCNSIGANIWHDILFISSALVLEGTWMKASYAWVFVVKLGGIFFALQSYHWLCCNMKLWRHPMLQPRRILCGEVKKFHFILQHTRTIFHFVVRLQFGIWYIIIGMVIAGVSGFYNKGSDVFAHHLS